MLRFLLTQKAARLKAALLTMNNANEMLVTVMNDDGVSALTPLEQEGVNPLAEVPVMHHGDDKDSARDVEPNPVLGNILAEHNSRVAQSSLDVHFSNHALGDFLAELGGLGLDFLDDDFFVHGVTS